MHGKGQKKMMPVNRNPNTKKPNLQIKVPQETDHGIKTMPGFGTFAKDEPSQSPTKGHTISSMTSPSHFKSVQPVQPIPQMPQPGKKRQEVVTIQKRASGKQVPTSKLEMQPRMSANVLGSPKVNMGRQKVLITYGSEKNLNSIKPMDKKQTPQSKAARMQELQRQLQDQKSRTSMLVSKQDQMLKEMEQLKKENASLRGENGELKKKIQKFKLSNEQTKRMLKQRINSFNEEGGEFQALKLQIQTFEARVNSLLEENHSLKTEINKYQCFAFSSIRDGRGDIASSTVREVVPLSGSRISGLYLRDSQDGQLKVFDGMEDAEEHLDLQSYITDKEESCLEEYKANVDIFDKIKQEYQSILGSMELKYKNLAEDYEETIASQAGQIYDLQLQNDELKNGQKGCSLKINPSIELDEVILRAQDDIAKLNLALFQLKASNKQLVEQNQHTRSQCLFLQTELQMTILKKHFVNQNDKFEFNVAKMNLLNIVDKLKLQVDHQKEKYERFKERVISRS